MVGDEERQDRTDARGLWVDISLFEVELIISDLVLFFVFFFDSSGVFCQMSWPRSCTFQASRTARTT